MIALVVVLLVGQPQPKVPVFVTSPGEGTYTDPSKDRQDSIRDLTQKIQESPTLTLAPRPDQAAVVLEVLGRETDTQRNALGVKGRSVLSVRLRAGDYSTELTGTGGRKGIFSGHGAAAGNIVAQVELWVTTNREKLPLPKVDTPR